VDIPRFFLHCVLLAGMVVSDPAQAPADHPDEQNGWEEYNDYLSSPHEFSPVCQIWIVDG